MKKHTKANGYFKDLCHYSRTGWAWWQKPLPGEVCQAAYCTCVPCKPPNTAHTKLPDSVRYLASQENVKLEIAAKQNAVTICPDCNGIYLCETPRPNCNDAVFLEMYEPNAVILATCWPRGGATQGQWIIKLMPIEEKYYE